MKKVFDRKNILFAGGIILFCSALIYSIYLVTHHHWLFGLTTEDGAIGDAINGITAPTIGIIGAVLIYTSFIQQIRANKLLGSQNELNLTISLLNELKKDIQILFDNERWGESRGPKPQPLTRVSAGETIPAAFGRHFIFVLQSYTYLYLRITKLELNNNDLTLLYQLLQSQYESYIQDYCKYLITHSDSSKDQTPIRAELVALSHSMQHISELIYATQEKLK